MRPVERGGGSEERGEAGAANAPREPNRGSLVQRTLLWAVLVICASLAVATASEAWTRHGIEQQVAAARERNAALQRDVTATQRAVQAAQSPAAIEREARAWGYIRAGDHPVIVVTQAPQK